MNPIQPNVCFRQVVSLLSLLSLFVVMLITLAARVGVAAPIQDTTPRSKTKVGAASVQAGEKKNASAKNEAVESDASPDQAPSGEGQIVLFDGETLDGWEVTNFGGEGECSVEEGCLKIAAGYPISGVNSTREDLPKTNYEISLEVKQTRGIDFFCGLTFPVAESHCTFIVGGWAGSVVGLSCIDDLDASSNDSRKLMKFEDDRWYKVRVRVQPERIQCWIDAEEVVDQNIAGKKISLRNETLASRPLGLCNFETTSHFKNIKIREFKPGDLENEESISKASNAQGSSKSVDKASGNDKDQEPVSRSKDKDK